jgi:hypothetical protein
MRDSPGNETATGEDFNGEEGEGTWPFRALLDVGLVRTKLETEFVVPWRVLWMEVWTFPIVTRGLRVLAKRTRV